MPRTVIDIGFAGLGVLAQLFAQTMTSSWGLALAIGGLLFIAGSAFDLGRQFHEWRLGLLAANAAPNMLACDAARYITDKACWGLNGENSDEWEAARLVAALQEIQQRAVLGHLAVFAVSRSSLSNSTHFSRRPALPRIEPASLVDYVFDGTECLGGSGGMLAHTVDRNASLMRVSVDVRQVRYLWPPARPWHRLRVDKMALKVYGGLALVLIALVLLWGLLLWA